MHLATKIRNRLLSETATLLLGNELVSIDVLRKILSSSSKFFHGLVAADLNPRDHQNFASCWRVTREEIFQVLSTIDDSSATSIYIRLLRSVIDAYIDTSKPLMERIFHAWTGVFISRFWRIWIDKMGKNRLDKLFFELTQRHNVSQRTSRTGTQQYSMTTQSIFSLELNAHCLVYLALLVAAGTLPEEVLSIDRFHSQTCEAIFRDARAFSSNSSCGVNFSVLQFINLSDKLSHFQTIKSQNEQLDPPLFRFPVHHKNKHTHLASTQVSSRKSPSTKAIIKAAVVRAYHKAVEYMDQVGVSGFLRKNGLSSMTTINDYARSLLEDKTIVDEYSQEADNEDEEDIDNEEDGCDDEELREGVEDAEDGNDEISGILGFHNDPDSLQPTFNTMRVVDNVPPHLAQSFFKIRINGHDKFIHKSSSCWVLTDRNQKLSADRTKRVTQAK